MFAKNLNLEGMRRRLDALGEKFPDLEEKKTFNLSLERPFSHLTSRHAESRSVIMAINRDGIPCLTAGDFAEANDERIAVMAPNAVFVPAMQVLSVFRKLHPEAFEKLVEVTDMLCTPNAFKKPAQPSGEKTPEVPSEEVNGPDGAMIIPIRTFEEDCLAGHFTDDDGAAYYGSATEATHIQVSCADAALLRLDKAYTHIWWYNK